MNQKTLKELADEYAANVAVLDSQIDRCRLAIVDARCGIKIFWSAA